jgi:hypothetical protein
MKYGVPAGREEEQGGKGEKGEVREADGKGASVVQC